MAMLILCLALNHMVDQAASQYQETLPRRNSSDEKAPTIGMLGVSSLEYIVSFLALQRLGVASLLLSTRLDDNALQHLLDRCECDHVIVQPAFKPAILRVKAKRQSLQVIDFVSSSRLTIKDSYDKQEVKSSYP
jgi:acyl-CoA synthetase (AMP-forming)/AMP-acid ligase II